MEKQRRYILILALAAASLVAVFWPGSPPPPDRIESPTNLEGEVLQRNLIYTLSIRNKSADLLENIEVQSYAPLAETAWQKVLETRSSRSHKIIEDRIGNRMLVSVLTLAPYATEVVSIENAVEMRTTPKPMDLGNHQYALLPAQYIESDHPAIVAAARPLKRDTVRDTAKAIFDFTISQVKPVNYIRENRGALYALEKRQGDCTEFSYLFVALARAAGIAARPIGGFVIGERGRLKAEGYHNWAEYLDGQTWRVVDPFMQVIDMTPEKYVAWRILGADEMAPEQASQRFLSFDQRLEVRID